MIYGDDGNDGGAYSSAMAEDGETALPPKGDAGDKTREDAEAQEELEAIHVHADPSRGNIEVAGGDRVQTDDAPKYGAADEQATRPTALSEGRKCAVHLEGLMMTN